MDSYEFLKKQYDVLKEDRETKIKKLQIELSVLNMFRRFIQKKHPKAYKDYEADFRKGVEKIMEEEYK